jgi:putative hydrolase of the HAD superfamily
LIRAVFFDWFNTLANYEPPREKLESQALQELGINAPPSDLKHGLLLADRYYFEENTISPILKRSPEEQARVFTRYQKTVLTEAGIDAAEEMLLKIIKRLQELYRGMTFVLFDDVLSTMKTLREQNLTLGLLTNLQRDIDPICEKLGVRPYLDFTVTSAEAGADKPEPPIFLLALERAGVDASETIHVGDQYKLDVAGARGVGISPILIDRDNVYPEITDCPRIRNLTELPEHLK